MTFFFRTITCYIRKNILELVKVIFVDQYYQGLLKTRLVNQNRSFQIRKITYVKCRMLFVDFKYRTTQIKCVNLAVGKNRNTRHINHIKNQMCKKHMYLQKKT